MVAGLLAVPAVARADLLTVSVTSQQETVLEGTGAVFDVTLSGGTGSAGVVVTYELGGTAKGGADYTQPDSTRVTIDANTRSKKFTITTLTDTVLEGDETLTVTLTDVKTEKGTVRLGTPGEATTTIVNQGAVIVSVAAVDAEDTANGTVTEGAAQKFAVALTSAVSKDVTVAYETADGTGTGGTDYTTAVSGASMVIPAGSTVGTISVNTLKDKLAEDHETFTLTLALSDPPANVRMGMGTATATIQDDDELTANLVGPSNVAEGTVATYTVQLTGGTSSADVVVGYSVTPADSAGVDYEAPSGRLTIPARTAEGTITIQTIADGENDPNITVTLDSATTTTGTVTLGTSSKETAVGSADAVIVSFTTADVTVKEGAAARYTVKLSKQATGAVTVNYATSGLGDPEKTGSLTIAAGSTTGTITVDTATLEDTTAEADVAFTVTLSSPSPSATTLLGIETARGTVEDDDTPAVSVRSLQTAVLESVGAVFEVTLSGTTRGSAGIVVTYELGGTAKGGADYTQPNPTRVTIDANTRSKKFTITTLTDTVLEGEETLTVTLTHVSTTGTAKLGTPKVASTRVQDAQEGSVTVSVAAVDHVTDNDNGTVNEGDVQAFTVTLKEGAADRTAAEDVTVKYGLTAGTATSGDYAGSSGTVTIAAGSSSATISVPTREDKQAEADETFSLRLTSATGGVTLGTDTATATILDDDPLTVSVSGPGNVAAGTDAVFTVSLSGGTGSAAVAVKYALTGDKTGTGSVTIPAGSSSKTLKVSTTGLSDTNTVTVTISEPTTTTGTVTVGTSNKTTTIKAANTVILSFTTVDKKVKEGGSATYTVKRSGSTSEVVTASWATAGLSPAESGTVKIEAGSSTGTITVDTVDNKLAEADVAFTVTLSSPSTGSLGIETARGTVEDDDTPAVSVRSLQTAVLESVGAVFEVTLSGTTRGSAGIVVTYELGGTAKGGADYTQPNPTRVTIDANTRSKKFTITTLTDTVLEGEETLTVTLTHVSTTGTAKLGTPKVASITIVETGAGTVSVAAVDHVTDNDNGTVNEGDVQAFTVTLKEGAADRTAAEDVTVKYGLTAGTATSGDYAGSSGTVTIAAGSSSATISVPTREDKQAEADETFSLRLTSATGGVTLGTDTATATILDDDPLTVSVSGPGNVAAGTDAVFTVSLSGGTGSAAVAVKYALTGDKTGTGSVTIPAGSSSKTLKVSTTGLSDTNTVTVTISEPTTTTGTVTVGTSNKTTTIKAANTVILSFTTVDKKVKEGGSATYTVKRSGSTSEVVTASWATAGLSPAESGTVKIEAGSSTGTITVDTVDNKLAEADVAFTVTLSSPSTGSLGIETARGTVEDDDTPAVSVRSLQTAVLESVGAVFEVTLSGTTRGSAGIVVTYELGGTAKGGADYTQPNPTRVTIDANTRSKKFTITTLTDTVLEGEETLTVTLTHVSTTGTAKLGTPKVASTRVQDAQEGSVTVSVAAVDHVTDNDNGTVNEGDVQAFTVTLKEGAADRTAAEDVTVKYGLTAGTATSGDYAGSSGTVTIAAGSSSATISVPTREDKQAEADETFSLRLTSATGGVTLGTDTATATILDDDPLTVSVSGSENVAEGDAARFTVSLSNGTGSEPVVVNYSVTGTATKDDDYGPPPGRLTIPARAATGIIEIQTKSDDVVEGDETLIVTLTSKFTRAGTVTIPTGSNSKTTTIKTADTVTVSVADVTAVEGDPATFTVTMSKTVQEAVTVGYLTTDGTAKDGLNAEKTARDNSEPAPDYVAAASTAEVVIPAGVRTATITVNTREDKLAEGDENFTLTLTPKRKPDNVALGRETATATITDDTLTVEVTGPGAVTEGEPVAFTVTLAGGPGTEDVVVDYTFDGTATAASDHTGQAGKLTIPAGATTGTVAVNTNDDDVLEGYETLVLILTDASPAESAAVGSPGSAVTVIRDNEDPVTVSIDDPPTVAEGRTATFTVTLSGKVGTDVNLRYETEPDTATSTDYTPVSGTLTIAAGETTGTITVETEADNDPEPSDETFTLRLLQDPSQPFPEGVTIKTARATATITDLVLVASVTAPQTVPEGQAAEFTVRLRGGTSKAAVLIDYKVDGTAGPDDYTASSGKLTIPSGRSTGTITIPTSPDTILDTDETIVVTLIDAYTKPGLAELGTPRVATTTIDDSTKVVVSVDDVDVDEGEPAVFTVTLTGTVSKPVKVAYATVDGTATAKDDYYAVSGQVEVKPEQTTKTFTVNTREDENSELPEKFTITLSGSDLPTGVDLETRRATATIIDDDVAIATLEGPATVPEGETASYTVVLSGPASADVVVTYTVTGGNGATADDDYTAPSGTLTITSGDLNATIEIPTIPDDVLDRGETLTVKLVSADVAVGAAEVGTPDRVTTAIEDTGSVTVTVTAASSVAESARALVFKVTLSGKVSADVVISYATEEDTALAGEDYKATASTVTVTEGQTTAQFMVEIVDDELAEERETFMVSLSGVNLPDGVALASATVTATIDDDDELTVTMEGPRTVPEGDAASFTLTLSQEVVVPVTVSYATGDGTATADVDYEAVDEAVVIPPGDRTAEFTVNTLPDPLAEDDETFTVMVRQLDLSLAFKTAPGSALTVTILDDDELTVTVTGPEKVIEGSVANYTVSLAGGTGSAPVVVDYTTDDSSAIAGNDYTAPSGVLTIAARAKSGEIAIQTTKDKVVDPRETLVVKLTDVNTAAGSVSPGSPSTARTEIVDPIYQSINRVNKAVLPGVARAAAASTLDALGRRMELAAPSGAPMAQADLAGLTGLYRALQANERALQDGTYDLAKVLGGSSFLLPLSAHEDVDDPGIGFAVWGSGDYRGISGGDPDADDVDWSGSGWSARLGADMRFIDSLLAGLAVSWTGGALDYDDDTGGAGMKGTYGSSLISVHPYVGWITPDFGLWAGGGLGWGGVRIDDSEADAQESGLTQWSLGGGANVALLSGDWFMVGGTTALKLRADGFLAAATVAENDERTIDELTVDVNQARASVEASHAQGFAGGGVLTPALEVGARYDGGAGDTGFGVEVGGGVSYADGGITAEVRGRALLFRDNYGEWGLSGLVQYDPGAPAHGLMVSVRPTLGTAASGVAGLWEHGTLDLLGTAEQAGGRVEAEIGYGVPVFGAAGVLTPFAGASLTDAGGNSLSLGSRLLVAPLFEVSLEALRSESAAGATPEHGLTLEGAIRW